MNFISMCSGIEAASVAFEPLGWKPLAYSEIEPFPCAVLKHRYPDVPNVGDLSKADWSVYRGKADLVCAGFPCQAFSVAGLRNSLEDSRGNLSIIGIRAIKLIRPRWIMLEQVPGVLSAPGNAFGCILAGLSGADDPLMPGTEDGEWRSAGIVSGPEYGLAWRVLNAEFFGVPQRRERIFLVGYLGDWRRAAQVLFEPYGLPGYFETGEKEGAHVATLTAHGVGTCGADDNQAQAGHLVIAHGQAGAEILTGKCRTLSCNHESPILYENNRQDSRIKEVDKSPSLTAKAGTGGGNLPLVLSVHQNASGDIQTSDKGFTVGTTMNASGRNTGKAMINNLIRRLTPEETEALQGFPRNYTMIPYRGKPAEQCPDGPRYKAIGNSWAVPCARWIAERVMLAARRRGLRFCGLSSKN